MARKYQGVEKYSGYAFVLAREKSIGFEYLLEKITGQNLSDPPALNTRIPSHTVLMGISQKEVLIDALRQSDGNQLKQSGYWVSAVSPCGNV